ncbi:MAG: hypothetical protein HC850_17280 [Rhodomicrobium sp.]|nr:hypothetical protein [Rhodomicrobium sp.]
MITAHEEIDDCDPGKRKTEEVIKARKVLCVVVGDLRRRGVEETQAVAVDQVALGEFGRFRRQTQPGGEQEAAGQKGEDHRHGEEERRDAGERITGEAGKVDTTVDFRKPLL